ncbi:MAG: PIN domain-containing protein [Thermodesulfobacteriota bacterium]|nr:PIN domain-containing protein [Thermodesulfobacteriota bacterium]
MVKYFFDSYAVIELIGGNPKYAKYSQEPFVITLFNLVEVYWFALREYSEKVADTIYHKLKPLVVDVDDDTLKEAMQFRRKNKRGLSYADCIGYVYALNKKLIFLTGDKEFVNMKNVEYVKR